MRQVGNWPRPPRLLTAGDHRWLGLGACQFPVCGRDPTSGHEGDSQGRTPWDMKQGCIMLSQRPATLVSGEGVRQAGDRDGAAGKALRRSRRTSHKAPGWQHGPGAPSVAGRGLALATKGRAPGSLVLVGRGAPSPTPHSSRGPSAGSHGVQTPAREPACRDK